MSLYYDNLQQIEDIVLRQLKEIPFDKIKETFEKRISKYEQDGSREYRSKIRDLFWGLTKLCDAIKSNKTQPFEIVAPGDSPTKILLIGKILNLFGECTIYSFPLSLKNSAEDPKPYIQQMLIPVIDKIKKSPEYDELIKKLPKLRSLAKSMYNDKYVDYETEEDDDSPTPTDIKLKSFFKKHFENIIFIDYFAEGGTFRKIIESFELHPIIEEYLMSELGFVSRRIIDIVDMMIRMRNIERRRNDIQLGHYYFLTEFYNLSFFFDKSLEFIMDAEKYNNRCIIKKDTFEKDNLVDMANIETVNKSLGCIEVVIDCILYGIPKLSDSDKYRALFA